MFLEQHVDNYGASHPGSTDRYLAIESAVGAVSDQIVNMQPLTPSLKKD